MVNAISRTQLLGGAWLVIVAGIVASSIAMGARVSTSAYLVALCMIPLGVMLVIGMGASPPTVAELLYATNHEKDGRS
jgi:hypothetical protein